MDDRSPLASQTHRPVAWKALRCELQRFRVVAEELLATRFNAGVYSGTSGVGHGTVPGRSDSRKGSRGAFEHVRQHAVAVVGLSRLG
jgi:hypothetical protein